MQAWAESLGGISYPLLSDFWPHGEVSEHYGVLRQGEGHSERAIFVLDRVGIIRYIDIHPIDDRPNNEELRKVLRALEAEYKAEAKQESEAAASMGVYAGEEDAVAIPEGDVVLYCARWCKDCRKAKAWLEEHGVSYVEVDIDYNFAARAQVRKWGGGSLITPVILFDETVILDYDVPRLEESLRRRLEQQ